MSGRSTRPNDFFTPDEERRILEAIRAAETRTSGEIRLHVERDVPDGPPANDDAYVRARQVFANLGMHRTAARNGVLVYLAVRARRFAVVGDEALHQRVGDGFWQDVVRGMGGRFGRGEFCEGVCDAIGLIGEKLRAFFPYQADDVNELPDDISYS
ncbi:MAG TPA: TPM domain-containing protein [Candidatus Krumholzibacteria bacterium]|nr:TPM domain-containing protein [Candidatus Krumholzibacteria bacterium]